MGRNKTILYGLLLALMVLAVTAAVSVGDAQGRYVNTDTWYTALKMDPTAQVSSNCLVEGGQTVLLGYMELEPEQTLVPFTLNASQTVTGIMSWSSSDPDYLQAGVLLDSEVITQETALELPEGGSVADLQLIPTEAARNTVHEALTVTVTVRWIMQEQTVSADFQVILPAVEELPETPADPDTPSDTEDPSETPEGTEQVPSDTPEETEQENGDTTQEQQPAVTSETDEPSEPIDDTTGTPDDTTGTPDDTTTEPDSEVEGASAVKLSSLTAFHREHYLPVIITVPQGSTQVLLTGSTTVEDTQTEDTQSGDTPAEQAETESGLRLPPFTRYSPDGGSSWYLLYYGGNIELNVPSGTQQIPLLLDLAGTEKTDVLNLQAQVYADGVSVGTAKHSLQLSDTPAVTAGSDPWILSDGKRLVLQLNPAWSECHLAYTVEMLTADKNLETVEYIPVELSEDTLYAIRDTQESLDTLTLRLGKKLPQAGTYRITFTWKLEDLCFATEQTSFFINYSSD